MIKCLKIIDILQLMFDLDVDRVYTYYLPTKNKIDNMTYL